MRPAGTILLVTGMLVFPGLAWSGAADVTEVAVRCNSENTCTFAVTVRHDDEGWDHYADSFEILSDDGEVLGTRVLRHPHVNEQPFTRTFQGVKIPESVSGVRVRAHDSVHGYGGEEKTVVIER